ncbi:MAG: folylpolyglutamate synthase [Candidatus Kapaibacterium sp.]|nr:MAG: folylpolyglutamate synthase [Candidatus Kapabacteria bacterium]
MVQEILDKLYRLQRRGIVPGLERVYAMLEHLGNPHERLRAIHVAGTNGKGTVSSVVASILMEAGEIVGLYTSPHIRAFNERIRINSIPISDNEIVELFNAVETVADSVGATFFEITTVMALSKFTTTTTTNILECGLGGRLDATNAVRPCVAVITSIDYDHQEWLGNTLEQIAFEKAGIIKSGIPAVIGEPRRELRSVFERRAQEVGASAVRYLEDIPWSHRVREIQLGGMIVELAVGKWYWEELFIPLHGEHQIRNIALAILVLEQYWETPPADAEKVIARGIANLRRNSGLRARIEVIRQDPLLVFDVAHNPAGCCALAKVLSTVPFPRTWNIVFGVMRDKDYRSMLCTLASLAERFYLASPRGERACDPTNLAQVVSELGCPFEIHASIASALDAASATGRPTLCTGSFFTIEEAFEYLDNT